MITYNQNTSHFVGVNMRKFASEYKMRSLQVNAFSVCSHTRSSSNVCYHVRCKSEKLKSVKNPIKNIMLLLHYHPTPSRLFCLALLVVCPLKFMKFIKNIKARLHTTTCANMSTQNFITISPPPPHFVLSRVKCCVIHTIIIISYTHTSSIRQGIDVSNVVRGFEYLIICAFYLMLF